MKKYIIILILFSNSIFGQTLREKITSNLGDNSGISALRLRTTLNYISDSLTLKVDKISGKGLSANDFTNVYKTALDALNYNLSTKQDQINGKGFVKSDGTIISYDNSTYLTGITSSNVTTALGYTPLNSIGGVLIGTAGSGAINYPVQSATPSSPTSGFKLFANSTGLLSWVGTNTYVRTLDGSGISQNRTYTLPDASGTFALLGSAQTWSGVNTFSSNLTVSGNTSLGTTNALGLVTMQKDQDGATAVYVTNRGSGTSQKAILSVDNGSYGINLETFGSTFSTSTSAAANRSRILSTSPGSFNFVSKNSPLIFWTGNTELERMTILTTGNVGIGTINPAQLLDVNGTAQATSFKVSAIQTAPASATATGTAGEIRFTASGIYIATATNTWIKCTGATF